LCYKSVKINNATASYIDVKCLIGSKFPDLDGETIEGKKLITIRRNEFPSVYNLWFIDCPPCVAEIPGLNKLNTDYNNVNFFSICKDSITYLSKFLDSTEFNFYHLRNGKDIIEKHLFEAGYPLTIIVDKDSIIIDILVGGRSDSLASEDIYAKISKILLVLLKY
jgi:thiol-disulfide isomerase/thioredoxin